MKKFFFYLMAVGYVLAGLNHFRNPEFYMQIMPPWFPWHYALVLLSGVAEIVVGILLVIPRTRLLGAWLTILLLIAIFPANIQMAIDYYRTANPDLWIALLRLPLQGLLIWWAWLYTKQNYFSKKVSQKDAFFFCHAAIVVLLSGFISTQMFAFV